MTIALDAHNKDTVRAVDPQSFTYTPVGTPKGIVVMIAHEGSTDIISGVTYGGVAMARVQTNVDTSTEPGRSYLYFLGAGIPTGAQTVSVDRTEGTTPVAVHVASLTADADTEVVDFDGIDEQAANPSRTLQYGGRESIAFAILFSGHSQTTDVTPNANCTTLRGDDFGTSVTESCCQTTPGTSDFAIGFTATSEDVAFSALAIAEVETGAPPAPSGSSATSVGASGQCSGVTDADEGIVADGLTSHWDFKDGSGTVINDLVGTNDGTLQGTLAGFWDKVDISGEPIGNFNGTDNYINTGITAFPAGDFSMVVAAYPRRLAEGGGVMLNWLLGGGVDIRIDSNGYRALLTSGATSIIHDRTLAYQHWVILTLVRTGTSFSFYLDKLKATATHTLTNPTGGQLRFGTPDSLANFWKGRFGDVLWYGAKALSDAEVEQNVDALKERFYGSAVVDRSDATLSKAIHQLPSDGASCWGMASSETQTITSDASRIYVAEFDGANDHRVFKYDHSWNLLQDVVVAGSAQDNAHRAQAIGIDQDGDIITIPGPHNSGWKGYRTTAGGDLTTFTPITDPYGGTGSLTYPSLLKRPSNGALWFWIRNFTDRDVWAWDPAAHQFTRIGGGTFWVDLPVPYGQMGAEAPGGRLYQATAWAEGSGVNFALRVPGIVYSDDDGTTWQRLSDNGNVTLALNMREVDAIAPLTLSPSGTPSDMNHPSMGVTDDGTIHVTLKWQNTFVGDTSRCLWHARWNDTLGYWVTRRLDPLLGGARLFTHGNNVHIVISERQDDTGGTTGKVWLYSSTDNGDNWTRRLLHDVVGENPDRLLIPDLEGIRHNGTVRIRVMYEEDRETITGRAEVWEFAAPADAPPPGEESGSANLVVGGSATTAGRKATPRPSAASVGASYRCSGRKNAGSGLGWPGYADAYPGQHITLGIGVSARTSGSSHVDPRSVLASLGDHQAVSAGKGLSRSVSGSTGVSAQVSGSRQILSTAGFARPNAVVTAGEWRKSTDGTSTDLHTMVDEAVADFSDYIQSGSPPAGAPFELALSDTAYSGINIGYILRWTHRVSFSSPTHTVTVILLQGTTLVASWAHTSNSITETLEERALTEAQGALITDPSDLRVRGSAVRNFGVDRQQWIGWIALQVPLATTCAFAGGSGGVSGTHAGASSSAGSVGAAAGASADKNVDHASISTQGIFARVEGVASITAGNNSRGELGAQATCSGQKEAIPDQQLSVGLSDTSSALRESSTSVELSTGLIVAGIGSIAIGGDGASYAGGSGHTSGQKTEADQATSGDVRVSLGVTGGVTRLDPGDPDVLSGWRLRRSAIVGHKS